MTLSFLVPPSGGARAASALEPSILNDPYPFDRTDLLHLEYRYLFHGSNNDDQLNLLKKLDELDTSDPDHFFGCPPWFFQTVGTEGIRSDDSGLEWGFSLWVVLVEAWSDRVMTTIKARPPSDVLKRTALACRNE